MTDARTGRPHGRRLLADPRWPIVAIVAGVAMCVLAARFSGAADRLPLLDPGALVRWGLPTVRVVNDLAAALTVGLLLLGGFLMPEAARTRRRERAARGAAWAAFTWGVAGVSGVVLGYADVSGRHVGSAGFWEACWQTTWQLEALRAPAITALAALLIALLCHALPGRNGQAWLFFAAVVSLVPLTLVGHAAGTADHDTAVNTLLVHLVASAIWIGGLLGLLALWSRLGKAAAVTVARFSRLAAWCYVAVGVSGLVDAWVRVGTWSGLDTRYGVLVLGKVACLGILGVFGYLQRQRVVARLQEDPQAAGSKRLFARLASVEVVVMGLAVGLATALARSAPPVPEVPGGSSGIAVSLTGYPAPGPLEGMDWFTAWRLDWLFSAVAVVGIGVYAAWVVRLRRRGDRWPWLRLTSWCLGWLIFAYLVNGAPAIYGRVMFSVHMLEHMAVSMLVPILLVRGGVVTLALRALPRRTDETLGPRELILGIVHSRYLRVLANPLVAAALMLGTLILFYYSPLFELALRTHTGHLLMTVHFVLIGYLYAWSLVGIDPGPTRWPAPLRLGILLGTITFHAFFGVALMTGTTLLGGDFFTTLHFVADPIVDQQRGGTVAWGSGELPTLLLTMLIAAEWYRRDRAAADRYERQAARDDDAEWKAYNDYLARRSRSGAAKE